MDKHFITVSLGPSTYSAHIIFHLNDRPIRVEVVNLDPPDYKPKLPYLFIANQQSRLLMWQVGTTADADFGEAIAREIYKKAKQVEIDLYT